jgi:hypothetical protein
LSHVKQALNERHKKAIEHVKEEYKVNHRSLMEKEHRTRPEGVVQDGLSSAKEQQERHDREIAQLLAEDQTPSSYSRRTTKRRSSESARRTWPELRT